MSKHDGNQQIPTTLHVEKANTSQKTIRLTNIQLMKMFFPLIHYW